MELFQRTILVLNSACFKLFNHYPATAGCKTNKNGNSINFKKRYTGYRF